MKVHIPILNVTFFGRKLMKQIEEASPIQKRSLNRFAVHCLLPGRLWMSKLKRAGE